MIAVQSERDRNDRAAAGAKVFFQQRMAGVDKFESCVRTRSGSDGIRNETAEEI
jgi:hypothetical protein